MANLLMRFKDGKFKALTLSYDDGSEQDERLIELMNEYGIKGTFNLNSGMYSLEGTVFPPNKTSRRLTRKRAIELYSNSGHEIAVHTLNHPYLDELPTSLCVKEVFQDRVNLEKDFKRIVRGMAYPYGTYNDDVVNILKECGIAYARGVESSYSFDLPKDWLRLKPTCRHREKELMPLAKTFVETKKSMKPMLFYLWGHSFEFEKFNNWYIIEDFIKYVSHKDDIWYATNIEIYDYVHAYEQLVFSASEEYVYNPTVITLYFEYNEKLYKIEPNETIIL